MITLKKYLENVSIRKNAAYISGDTKRWMVNDKLYTDEEFNQEFPIDIPIMPKKFKGLNQDIKRNFVNNQKSY